MRAAYQATLRYGFYSVTLSSSLKVLRLTL